jgi:hypothetical protein
MRTFLFILLGLPAMAANFCVGTITGITCDTSYAASTVNLQTALDTAADGDSIYLQPQFIFTTVTIRRSHVTPVTVYGILPAWAPCSTCRITPSYEPLTAYITPEAINIPAVQGMMDDSGNPPKGWNFIGITFWYGVGKGSSGGTYDSSIVSNGGGQITFETVFNGTSITGSTAGASSTITLSSGLVKANWVNTTLQIEDTSANWIKGQYIIQSVNVGANTITLDRNVSTGAASALGGTGSSWVAWEIRNSANEPQNFTFDRTMIRDDLADATTPINMPHGYRLNGRGHTIKNSFTWPIASSSESHAVIYSTNSCPSGLGGADTNYLTNNFLSASGISFFSSGSDSDYDDGAQSCAIIRYNHSYKPFKWWPATISSNPTNNPKPSYYITRTLCTKNLGEWKSSAGSIIEYNMFENVWEDNFCQGQYFGFTSSPRNITESYGSGFSATSGTSTFSLTGAMSRPFTWKPGTLAGTIGPAEGVLCSGTNPIECRPIASWNEVAQTGTITGTWSSTYSNAAWTFAREKYYILNHTIKNNYFKNVSMAISILVRDGWHATPVASGGTNYSRIKGFNYSNNLIENTINMGPSTNLALGGAFAMRITFMQYPSVVDTNIGGSDFVIEHNTWKLPTSSRLGSGIQLVTNLSQPNASNARITNLDFRSNFFPLLRDDGGNYYPWGNGESGYTTNFCTPDDVATGTFRVTHNFLPRTVQGAGCSRMTVTGNIPNSTSSDGTISFLANTAKITPGSAQSKAAHDGTDIGADEGKIPTIKNLRVTARDRTALLEFDLSGPIADAGNTQPCVLEVSTDSDLDSYLGPYTPINALNPTMFKQPDSTLTTNTVLLRPITANGHVTWPIGQNNAAVTDDNSVSRDLRLTANTLHYGRVMCYGAAEAFTFTTAAAPSSTTAIPFTSYHTSAATLRVDYGATHALGSNTTSAFSASNASLTVPVTAGTPIYTQVSYLNGGGGTIYQGPIQIRLP